MRTACFADDARGGDADPWGSVRNPPFAFLIASLHSVSYPAKFPSMHATARLRRGSTTTEPGGLVFPSARGKQLADARLSKLLEQLGIGAVPHGFRSSFRDWASERTDHPRKVIEAALAHVVRNQTEAAYARSDLFDRRRQLMDDWMKYLDAERSPRPTVA